MDKGVMKNEPVKDNALIGRFQSKALKLELAEYLRGAKEMLVTELELYAEEQRKKADYFEKQCLELHKALITQTKSYERFSDLVAELTDNYRELGEECGEYKRRNKQLWQSVESLESKCDVYMNQLHELELKQVLCHKCVTDERSNNEKCVLDEKNVSEKCDLDEKNSDVFVDKCDNFIEETFVTHADNNRNIVSALAEESSRILELERAQRSLAERKYESLLQENDELNQQVLWLEYRLKNDGASTQYSLEKNKWRSVMTIAETERKVALEPHVEEVLPNIPEKTIENYEVIIKQKSHHIYDFICSNCGHTSKYSTQNKKSKHSSGNVTTAKPYSEMFQEIFKKLKDSGKNNKKKEK